MPSYLIHAIVSLIAVMNPLGILPTYLALTSNASSAERRRIAKRAVINAFLILIIFLLIGHDVLSFFGITIQAFQIAGGILLFGIAYRLLNATPSYVQSPRADESSPKHDITLTPLALPIMAGPGTITTVMALSVGPQLVMHTTAVFIAVIIVLLTCFALFYYASWITGRISHTALNAITRLMGFILSIIAVQMALTGLHSVFPGWG
ncbi:MarC family protein [Ferroacidibacillus organovorans]|uniref:UPF0056 membrane protein n=1 Tax=Ferroacidibacillus organovorans TaxID=1765683 RepID=A0A853KB13_9BACL|nr:MarC family protein [Ferroacidibacillus organovorans]KYP81534.1 hypothetical protein AYJ22_07335 [Ferroacidibacillus organovorans]OAG94033.1 hypothetical protein AYW79_07315 [Ferroacidibacillus organovorans]